MRNVRSLSVTASLAVLFMVSYSSIADAASARYSAHTSYSPAQGPYSSSSAGMSRAEQPVPPNCIRQECGKLWCWQMKGEKTSSH